MKYGCHNREPFKAHYFATGGDKPIPHGFTKDCQYRHTELGKVDSRCDGCRHRDAGSFEYFCEPVESV